MIFFKYLVFCTPIILIKSKDTAVVVVVVFSFVAAVAAIVFAVALPRHGDAAPIVAPELGGFTGHIHTARLI
jgi:hypothetical protein